MQNDQRIRDRIERLNNSEINAVELDLPKANARRRVHCPFSNGLFQSLLQSTPQQNAFMPQCTVFYLNPAGKRAATGYSHSALEVLMSCATSSMVAYNTR